jgi:hypothetical protein
MKMPRKMQYKSLKDKILKILGFRKIPVYRAWDGKYLGFYWEFMPWVCPHLRD